MHCFCPSWAQRGRSLQEHIAISMGARLDVKMRPHTKQKPAGRCAIIIQSLTYALSYFITNVIPFISMYDQCATQCRGTDFHGSEQVLFEQQLWMQLRTQSSSLCTTRHGFGAITAISGALTAPEQARTIISSVLATI